MTKKEYVKNPAFLGEVLSFSRPMNEDMKISVKFEKQFHHLGIALVSRTHQRGVAVVVLDVHRTVINRLAGQTTD